MADHVSSRRQKENYANFEKAELGEGCLTGLKDRQTSGQQKYKK